MGGRGKSGGAIRRRSGQKTFGKQLSKELKAAAIEGARMAAAHSVEAALSLLITYSVNELKTVLAYAIKTGAKTLIDAVRATVRARDLETQLKLEF